MGWKDIPAIATDDFQVLGSDYPNQFASLVTEEIFTVTTQLS